MTHEAAKELDRRCVWNWLCEVYRSPGNAYYTYSDEQLTEFAHDALVLLKEQEPKTGHWIDSAGDDKCSVCGATYSDLYPDYQNTHYCPNCGAKMIGTDVPTLMLGHPDISVGTSVPTLMSGCPNKGT